METTLSGIRLDENHVYWRGEQRVPGFTEIATDLGVIEDNNFYTEFGRDRGTAVHQWVRFLAEGGESEESPDERIAGFLEAFKVFLKDTAFVFHGGEEPAYHPSLVFACSPDLWGDIGGRLSVIDIKTGGKTPWHPLQTAAQSMALNAQMVPVTDRYALYIKDGKYRLESHKDKDDMKRWGALVTAYHAKKFHTRGNAL